MNIPGRLQELNMITQGLIKSLFHRVPAHDIQAMPIDFIVAWVDGNDPAWQQERAQYVQETAQVKAGNGVCRYRDWSSFRYWFRAVETYAPWVRYVHLVTWGHVPAWLNLDHPKLKIVKHTDFMPQEYLPTFNCNPLELNLFRIPNLSEHFVYFNDDMLLARPLQPEDFFANGLPRHTAVAYPWVNRDNGLPYHLFFNGFGIVNRKHNAAVSIKAHPEKWFSWSYKSAIKHNIEAYRNQALPGMLFTHMGAPYVKSSMEKTWKEYEKVCHETSLYRIRDIHQITHQIYSIEDILNGAFEPAPCDWGEIVHIKNINRIAEVFRDKKHKMMCLSDDDALSEEEVTSIDKQLESTLNAVFPKCSAFELNC